MSIIVQFPDLPVSHSGFQIITATELLFSPYNKVEDVWEEPDNKWRCSLAFNFLTRAEFRVLNAHLASLRGHVGVTSIKDMAHQNAAPQSAALVCSQDGQYGNLLNVSGATPNTLVANAGDRCQIGNQLLKISEDAQANASGHAVFKVQPEIRNPFAVGQPVITQTPRGEFRIKNSSSLPTWSGNKNIIRGIQIDFI